MDGYRYWRANLRSEIIDFIDEPQCGFWRSRSYRGGPWVAIAIFVDQNDEIVCVYGDEVRPSHYVWSPFLEAITEETYRAARVNGRFTDDYEARDGSLTTDLSKAKAVMPIVGKTNGRNHSGSRDR
jgi:hypothetical protein